MKETPARRFLGGLREARYRALLGLRLRPAGKPPSFARSGRPGTSAVARALRDILDDVRYRAARPPALLAGMEGMSGQKYRHLIGRVIAAVPEARYLEIGSWKGSTAAAAILGNKIRATCIDNWSLDPEARAAFLANTGSVLSASPDAGLSLIDSDFRDVDYTTIGRHNVFLFDGPHEEQDHYDGIRLAGPALDRELVLIVDDWNWRKVRLGTFRALRDGGWVIPFAVEVRTTRNDTHPAVHGPESDWHNGCFIAFARRPD